MHPEKKAIKIIQSWKTLGQFNVCSTKRYSGQKGTPGKLLEQLLPWDFLVFYIFLEKTNLKTQMRQSLLQVYSIANY